MRILNVVNKKTIAASACSVGLAALFAVPHATEARQSSPPRPTHPDRIKANVADLAWLAGSWSGPGLGGRCEEHWTKPAGGSLLGMFRLVDKDQKSTVYELLMIEQEGEHVVFRFRHFGPGHKPWEPNDKPLEFDLIQLDENEAVFESAVQTDPKRMTYRRVTSQTVRGPLRRVDRDELRIRVQGEKDGKLGQGFQLSLNRSK